MLRRYRITDLYCEEILPPVDCQLIWTISYFPSFSHISTLMEEIRTSYRLARGISSTNSVNSHPPSPLGIVDEEPQALPFLSTLMPPGRGFWPLPWQIWKRYLLRFACLRIGKNDFFLKKTRGDVLVMKPMVEKKQQDL